MITILAAVLIPYFSDLIGKAEDAAAAYNARVERYEQLLTEPTATTCASEPEPTIIETAAPETAPAPTEPPLPEPYEQVRRWNTILSASERTHPTMHDALTELADGEENIPDIVNAFFAAEAAAPQTAKPPIIVWDQESDRFTVVTEKTSETVRFHSAPDEPPTELPAAFAYRLWRVYNEDTESPFDNSQRYNPHTVDVYSIYWAASSAPESLVNATKFYVGFDMGLWTPTEEASVHDIHMASDQRFKGYDFSAVPIMKYRTNGNVRCWYHPTSNVSHYGDCKELLLTGEVWKNEFTYYEHGAFVSFDKTRTDYLRYCTLILEEECTVSDTEAEELRKLYDSKKIGGNFIDHRRK